jgi:hypothetical protein
MNQELQTGVVHDQLIRTVKCGPQPASVLEAWNHPVVVLAYDRHAHRYRGILATVRFSGVGRAVSVRTDKCVEALYIAAEQHVKMSGGAHMRAANLSIGDKLFGAAVDLDDDSDERIHLRDGLKSRCKLADLANDISGALIRNDAACTPSNLACDHVVTKIVSEEDHALYQVTYAALPGDQRSVDGLVLWTEPHLGTGTGIALSA